jgi:hypothetical protein
MTTGKYYEFGLGKNMKPNWGLFGAAAVLAMFGVWSARPDADRQHRSSSVGAVRPMCQGEARLGILAGGIRVHRRE